MGDSSLAVRLDIDTAESLRREAERQHIEPDEVAGRAIKAYLDYQEREREVLRERIAEADRGVFISGDAMHRWIESWDTENELPPPEPDVFLPPRK